MILIGVSGWQRCVWKACVSYEFGLFGAWMLIRLGETASLPSWPGVPPPSKTLSRLLSRQQVAAERDPLEPTATRDCPHCHQSVTIVALLATPEVARPSVPTTSLDIVPLRRAQ